MSSGRILACLFWEAHGTLFIDHLETGRTTNKEYYITLLVYLKNEIVKTEFKIEKKKVLFYQANAQIIAKIEAYLEPKDKSF